MAFQFQIAAETPESLVFTDECGVNLKVADRLFGWSYCGTHAHTELLCVWGSVSLLVFYPVTIADTNILSSFSVLPALSLDGVVYSNIMKGLYDGNKFVHFVDELTNIMNPYPGKHSVLVMVMDNCKIHHVPAVEEVCAQKYVSSSYLDITNHNIIGYQATVSTP